MRRLHPLQKSILEALRNPPEEGFTYRGLQRHVGASSPSQVLHHLEQLERKGFVKRYLNDPRHFMLIKEAEDEFSFLPLLALASCGHGIDNTDHVIENIPVSSRLIPIPLDKAFLVEARGESMIPKIRNKDVVLVEKNEPNAMPNGKIVVCEYDGEAKIKEFCVYGDEFVLKSINSKFPDQLIEDKRKFKIHGIVRGVLFSRL